MVKSDSLERLGRPTELVNAISRVMKPALAHEAEE